MSEYSVVGQPLPRVDALEKVTGEAVFSVDVSLPNMIHGKVLRSPHAHAAIKRLDVTKARELDGVMAVITAADVPSYQNRGELSFNQLPHLAREKVVYHGQPVAAVAAKRVEIAEKALDLIEVDYEVLPVVFDPLEAMKPSAPIVHEILRTNIIAGSQPNRGDSKTNIAYNFLINKGDVEAGFKEADIILENTYRTQKIHHGYIEPFAALASMDKGGKITVWTHSQGLFTAREMIAHFLGIPANRIKLKPVEIGGGFGGKTYQPVAPLCALLSMKSGRPVRMELTREETLKDSRPAPESIISLKMGVTKKGTITAASAELIYDSGAYPEMSNGMFTAGNVLCHYKIPNVSIDTKDVLTNKVPTAYYRAPATPQAHFAIESHMDILAEKLGLDPIQFRLQNAAEKGDIQPNGEVLPRVGFKEALARMELYLKEKGRLEGKNRGRGIACGFWHGGTGSFGAWIHVNNDGSVNLVLGVTDISGSRTSIAQIVAEELGLPLDKVKVVIGDTESGPWATNSVGSLTVYSLSTAAYRACQDVKAQFGLQAAKNLGVDASEIEFSNGLFREKGDTSKSISFADLARSTAIAFGKGPVLGRGSVDGMPSAPTLSVHAVDVEVDDETGKIRVLNYAVAQDVGRAINPMSIEGQIQGAVVQGIGWALMEGYIYKEGVLQNTTFLDYRMPTATDVPPIDIMIVEVPSEKGVYGLRHVGEPPMIATLAAVANAVHQATGVRFKELPLTPEAVLKGMKKEA